MGRLKSVAIFEHTKNCMGGEEQDPMPCCENVYSKLKVEEITQTSFEFDSQPELLELAVFSWLQSKEIGISSKKENTVPLYIPPPPDIDTQSNFQVFII